jgi:hypothetical protein
VTEVATVPVGTASGPTLGTFKGASLTANFALAQVSATVSVAIGGTNLVGTASGMAITGGTGSTGSLTFDSSTCQTSCSASIKGLFAGPNAEFAAMTYSIGGSRTTNLATTAVVGAVTFAR